jgi:DNA-binding phage protein
MRAAFVPPSPFQSSISCSQSKKERRLIMEQHCDDITRDGAAVIDTLRAQIERIGWTETARRSGIARETLHKAFKRRSMSFMTVQRVADAVGVRLEARPQ